MRKLAILIASVLCVMIASGCAAETEQVDIKELAETLRETLRFEDELTPVDEKTAGALYQIDDAVRSCVYISSGATAEEIAAFELKDGGAAEKALEKAQGRIAEQRENFALYIPEEADRLNKAVVERFGRYVVVCVSADGAAGEIISDFME